MWQIYDGMAIKSNYFSKFSQIVNVKTMYLVQFGFTFNMIYT